MTHRQRFILLIGLTLALHTAVLAQPASTQPPLVDVPTGRIFKFYGDLRVLELDAKLPAQTMFDLILYSRENEAVARQRVGENGRYSFNIVEGNYLLAVELNNVEIARLAIHVAQRKHEPIRQDLELEWTPSLRAKSGAVSTPADSYTRTGEGRKLFEKAIKQINYNELPRAIAALRSIVAADRSDELSWNELGLVYFIQKDFTAAENSYAKAIEARPDHLTAYLNLGRMRLAQRKPDAAIAAFQSALQTDPKSAIANYFLGEAYLAAGKESIALGYITEALKIDPDAMAMAHLRLATVYNRAGRKDLAALQYNEFLKKKPEYPDAQRLREYIKANNPRTKRSSAPSPTPDP